MARLTTIPKRQETLTPELRAFLDRAIVPAMVDAYLAMLDAAEGAAPIPAPRPKSPPGRRTRAKPPKDLPTGAMPPLENT